MSKEEHNIDRLFKESFEDFEVDAPESAWGNIEKKLVQKNTKPIVPLWQKIAGVAAIIAIAILAGSQWFMTPEANNSIVNTPNTETSNDDQNIQNKPVNERFINPNTQNTNSVVSSDKINTISNQTSANSKESDKGLSNSSTLSSNTNQAVANAQKESSNITKPSENYSRTNSAVTSANYENAKYSTIISSYNSKTLAKDLQINLESDQISNKQNEFIKTNQKSLLEVAAQIEEEEKEKYLKKDKQEKSWFVKPQISPIFYGSLGNGSAIDQNFDQSSGQGEVNVSYGLNVAYKLNEKIKIRTGINRVNLNYNTNDVFVLPSSGFSSINNVDVVPAFQNSIINRTQLTELEDSEMSIRLPSDESQLQQQLGFIEVPMEVEYKLVDKAIDVNIIGGASTLLLNNNSIDIQTGNESTFLGEANNVNKLSFSTNFALGLGYDISEKLSLNLEPTFKYQINTFQPGSSDFQPYFIGVYSGIAFKF
jgi:hypothetical protein